MIHSHCLKPTAFGKDKKKTEDFFGKASHENINKNMPKKKRKTSESTFQVDPSGPQLPVPRPEEIAGKDG